MECCPEERYTAIVHGTTLEKNKLHALNSVNSIVTLAIPLLYTKHYSFLNVPETWEANAAAGIFLTISNRSSWIDSAVWIRQSDAEEFKKEKKEKKKSHCAICT